MAAPYHDVYWMGDHGRSLVVPAAGKDAIDRRHFERSDDMVIYVHCTLYVQHRFR